ncbi:MAG: hypothetical protein ACOCM9_08140, partial [Segatella copri]
PAPTITSLSFVKNSITTIFYISVYKFLVWVGGTWSHPLLFGIAIGLKDRKSRTFSFPTAKLIKSNVNRALFFA